MSTTDGPDRGERAFPRVPLLAWPFGLVAATGFAIEPRAFFFTVLLLIGALGTWEWWCAFRRWLHDGTPMDFTKS